MIKDFTDKEDRLFRELLSKSQLQEPFSDLEDKVMTSVQKRAQHNTSITRDIKLSWIFFILGSVFGIIVSLLIPGIREPVLGVHLYRLSLPLQVLIVLLLVYQLDSLVALYRKQVHKN